MNEIQQYRKQSAEWMGCSEEYEENGIIVKWLPDQDVKQMAMMLKQVLKSSWQVYIFAEANGEYWIRFKCIDRETIQEFSDTLETAFMKAFMEYLKQTK